VIGADITNSAEVGANGVEVGRSDDVKGGCDV
jgi:hypothetical protein